MSIAPDLLELMPHTVVIEPYIEVADAWGTQKSYGAAVSYQGRVVNKRRKVLNAMGGEVISETTIYLATTAAIGMDDRLTLPTGFTPSQPTIIRIERVPDEEGLHHTVINC